MGRDPDLGSLFNYLNHPLYQKVRPFLPLLEGPFLTYSLPSLPTKTWAIIPAAANAATIRCGPINCYLILKIKNTIYGTGKKYVTKKEEKFVNHPNKIFIS